MTDPLRVGLFALSLGAVMASSLLVVSPLRLGGTGTVLALWLVGCGQIVLLAEGLSLLHALDWPGFLAGHALLLGGAVLWARRWPAEARWYGLDQPRAGLARLGPVVWDWQTPALPLLAVAVVLVGLISLGQALWVPPNSWDSLSYHLSRIGYYLQFGSLDHYPVDDARQFASPPNAELLILWTVAFLRADWLANLAQLLAWVVTSVAVYGLGRQVGFGSRGAVFAAGLFALLPQSVLQSTSTLNDLAMVSFVAASLYFLLHASGQ
ncbi:MAG: glycosyltransferase family 39 protein, partial [Chloroflexi bacterium]|nr:glycosyltransferase family 39 protein [Chloroflexota bacterium]